MIKSYTNSAIRSNGFFAAFLHARRHCRHVSPEPGAALHIIHQILSSTRFVSYNDVRPLMKKYPCPFKASAEKGELVEISEIEAACQNAAGYLIGTSQIYYVLHCRAHQKVMLCSRHLQKTDEEVIETSEPV